MEKEDVGEAKEKYEEFCIMNGQEFVQTDAS